MYAIQSLKSKRYLKIENDSPKWEKGQTTKFNTEEEAQSTIKIYRLSGVEVIPVYQENNDTVTRFDRTIDFLAQLREAAMKKGITDVGIQRINKILNQTNGFADRTISNKVQRCILCEVNGSWYEIYYTHPKEGYVEVDGYQITNRQPIPLDRIAYLKRANEIGAYKLIFGIHQAKRSYTNIRFSVVVPEQKEYIIDNPHSFLQGVRQVPNKQVIVKNKPKRKYEPTQSYLCYVDEKWKHIIFEHSSAGRIKILKLNETKERGEPNEKVAILNGNKLTLEKWGGAKTDPYETYLIDNLESITKQG